MRQFLALMGFGTFLATTCAGSSLVLGARGGAPVTTSGLVTSSLGLSSHPFMIGPTAGVKLPYGFSVEGDALFKRESLSLAGFGSLGSFGARADSWQFPVMVKYTPGQGFLAPVLGAGMSYRRMNDVRAQVLEGSLTSNAFGFVAGAGLRFKAGAVSIVPEVRYTRWNSPSFTQSLLNTLTGDNNEAQVLIGITF